MSTARLAILARSCTSGARGQSVSRGFTLKLTVAGTRIGEGRIPMDSGMTLAMTLCSQSGRLGTSLSHEYDLRSSMSRSMPHS